MAKIAISSLSEPEDETAPVSQPGLFYGWWIVLAGTAILFVSSGIGFYCHGVILDPLRSEHGWSKATISTAITLYFLATGIFGMLIGRLIDRYGPKWFLVIGSLIIGSGFVFLSLINATWQLYAIYLFMSIGFSCTSLVPVNTLITNWFIRKRGFAMSLTNTGLSLGGIVLVPFASYLISHRGLQVTLPVLGTIFWMVIIPTALFFIKQRPSDLNQFPDGKPPEDPGPESAESPLSVEAQMRVWTRWQAVRTVAFWAIVLAFLMALGGQIAFMVHQVSFLSQYLGTTGAATAVSITAGASIVGRLLLGTFVDRCDKRYVTMVCFLIQGIAVISLAHYNHVVVLYLGTFAFGLTMGAIIMMQSLITGECFGLRSFATVSGIAGLFTLSGAAFGPMLAGFIYDVTNSYRMAFTIFAILSIFAIIVIYFARPPNPRNILTHKIDRIPSIGPP
jgi:MFS family permease